MLSLPICHTILMPSELDSEVFSIFQGFSPELLEPDYLKIFYLLKKLPYDLLDIFVDPEGIVKRRRLCSSSHIHLINEKLVNHNYLPVDEFFQILWCTSKTLTSAKSAVSNFKHKPILISTCSDSEAELLDDLDEDKFADLLLEKIDYHLSQGVENNVAELLEQLKKKGITKRKKGALGITQLNHGAVIPNANVLQVYGYTVDDSKVTVPREIDETIISTTKIIDEMIAESSSEISGKNQAIIYTTSIYTHLYNTNFSLWRDIGRKLDNNFQRELLRKILIRNDGYSRFKIEVGSESELSEMHKAFDNPFLRSLITLRQSELNLFTQIIAIKAASQVVPAIRLPNSVNLHHDKLNVIASLISKSDSRSRFKLNQRLKEYRDIISSEIGLELSKISFSERERLLTICDFPIEWISMNGQVPLMFSHEISRVPVIPGNMFLHNALATQEVFIPYSSLTKILVVRSFQDNDPIKDHLLDAIKICTAQDNSLSNINIKFVDVNSEDELCNALNDFNGAIVIFDCHGGHGGNTKPGWLSIGSEQIDIWKLKGKTKVPIICLLSACSTHPINGSHASVANGLFHLGAHSILGTFAPISSTDAAAFFMRILYRISAFIPLVVERHPISWRTIITGMFRMSYVTDVIRGLQTSGLLTSEVGIEICQKANMYINSFRSDWFKKFTDDVLPKTDMTEEQFHKLLENEYQFVETMLYSHLGQPEDLMIVKDQ